MPTPLEIEMTKSEIIMPNLSKLTSSQALELVNLTLTKDDNFKSKPFFKKMVSELVDNPDTFKSNMDRFGTLLSHHYLEKDDNMKNVDDLFKKFQEENKTREEARKVEEEAAKLEAQMKKNSFNERVKGGAKLLLRPIKIMTRNADLHFSHKASGGIIKMEEFSGLEINTSRFAHSSAVMLAGLGNLTKNKGLMNIANKLEGISNFIAKFAGARVKYTMSEDKYNDVFKDEMDKQKYR